MRTRSEEAFRRHYDHVFRFVRRRTPDEHQAEELTQAVFADAARGLESFKPGATPVLGWLYTVAQRRLADRSRALARDRRLQDAAAGLVAAAPDIDYGPDVAGALRSGLARLPAAQREVVVLKLLNGLAFSEIAERVGATEAACKMRFTRGLELLRDEFEREGIEP